MSLFQVPDEAERESIVMDLLDGSDQLWADVSLRALSQRCPVSTGVHHLLGIRTFHFFDVSPSRRLALWMLSFHLSIYDVHFFRYLAHLSSLSSSTSCSPSVRFHCHLQFLVGKTSGG